MKRATLPFNFHICISTAAGTILTPQITVLLQSCVQQQTAPGPAEPRRCLCFCIASGHRHGPRPLLICSRTADLTTLPWGEGEQSLSQTRCPSSTGWQSRGARCYTRWSSLCSRGRLSVTHLMLGRPWLSLSQPLSQLGGRLKATSPNSFCFNIILLPSFQQHD